MLLALGAGAVDAFLPFGHFEPGGFGAKAAVADIVERRCVGIGAGTRGVLTIGDLRHHGLPCGEARAARRSGRTRITGYSAGWMLTAAILP
ncbi:MAG TPA: hypothetical protein VLG14_16715, partial [Sphingomonas sp.]|nr:hypothetical protein [Sphingomonas sp.]